MKKERILAVLLLAALALLAARALFGWPTDHEGIIPVEVDVTQPFYPVYFGSLDNGLLEPEFHQGSGTIEQVLADLLAGPSCTLSWGAAGRHSGFGLPSGGGRCTSTSAITW